MLPVLMPKNLLSLPVRTHLILCGFLSFYTLFFFRIVFRVLVVCPCISSFVFVEGAIKITKKHMGCQPHAGSPPPCFVHHVLTSQDSKPDCNMLSMVQEDSHTRLLPRIASEGLMQRYRSCRCVGTQVMSHEAKSNSTSFA